MGSRLKKNAGLIAVVLTIVSAILVAVVVLQAIDLRQKLPMMSWGNVTEGFGAAATFLAVAVALWQSIVVRRQAQQEAREVAARFQQELESQRELAQADLEAQRELSRVQLEAQQELSRRELEAQRELARTQRIHQRELDFKLALVRVSKAADEYTHELATLIEMGTRAATLPEKQDRADALLDVSKALGLTAKHVSNEITGAHMLTRNDELHNALNVVNMAMLTAVRVEMAFRAPILDQGSVPNAVVVYQAMDAIQTALGAVRQLAGDVLDTGWED